MDSYDGVDFGTSAIHGETQVPVFDTLKLLFQEQLPLCLVGAKDFRDAEKVFHGEWVDVEHVALFVR